MIVVFTVWYKTCFKITFPICSGTYYDVFTDTDKIEMINILIKIKKYQVFKKKPFS